MQLDFIQSLNRDTLEREPHNPGVEGAIESFELAFRMQKDLPKVMDIASETRGDQGPVRHRRHRRPRALAGSACWRGVSSRPACASSRSPRTAGTTTSNLKTALSNKATSVDKPIAGLLQDLKARGLLKDTLVLWGGEFGRTPYAQGTDGRDHNHRGFTMWMAGGGVKGGFSYGATDDYGYEAVEGKMHIHDWHATILHLLGLDHEKLTYRYAGRDMRLTDVKGNVVKDIIA